MPRLADLLRAETFNEEAVHAKLENWGFAETQKPAKATTRRAFAHSMTSRRTMARRAAHSMAARSGETSDALRSFAPSRPTSRAEKLVDSLATNAGERDALFPLLDDLLEDLARAADPLRALLNFSRFCDAIGERITLFRQLQGRPALRSRLCQLFGFAQSLADTLIRDPELLDVLSGERTVCSRGELRHLARVATESASTPEAALDALRRFRRHQTLRIGLLDLERQTWRDEADYHLIVRQISDLAQVCVEETLHQLGDAAAQPFLVVALGKMGARELNYSSDIDLVFLHDGDHEAMNEFGQRLFKALSDATESGSLFRVDMRLRPEGAAGPLATPLDYAFSYYESYAGAWEWQALIKARAVAGDAKLARRFRRFTRGITWAKRADDAHLKEIVEMKRRSESTPAGEDARNVKQGPGGIRDAEWVVQQLQMMVGPQHPRGRAKDTLRAIKVLTELGAMTEAEARELREGYLFLRVLEHRLQLWEEQAIRVLPEDEIARAALSRRLGCNWRGTAAARWLDEEHTNARRAIRALCERMFWGWRETTNSESVSQSNETTDGAHLNGTAPHALSVDVPHLASPRLRRLAEGTSTQPMPAPLSRQIKAVLPTVAKFAEAAPDPERALMNLERLCDASGNRLSLLRALADTPRLGRGVLTLLGGSQFLSDTLVRFPELLDLAAQRSLLEARKTGDEARADCRAYCLTFRDRAAALRRWKAREILRIGLRDLVLDASPHDIASEIAALCGSCLDFANEEVGARLRPASHNLAFAVLGMGKLGGRDMHYSSDADVIFCHEVLAPFENAPALAARWAEELIKYLGERTEDGTVFSLDPRLRPEGASGALAPNFASFTEYFERENAGVEIWERQALTRARAVAGDAALAGKLMATIRHVAFPEVWQSAWSAELRHIKERVENERAAKAKTSDELFDVKLGNGGLSDIEWTAQWLALRHGAAHPALQTRSTLLQIEAASETGVLATADADALIAAYTFLRRAELRLQIASENAVAAVVKGSKEWIAWTRAMYADSNDAAARFEEEWHQHTRTVRGVFEKVRAAL